jgi:hypothetical protein
VNFNARAYVRAARDARRWAFVNAALALGVFAVWYWVWRNGYVLVFAGVCGFHAARHDGRSEAYFETAEELGARPGEILSAPDEEQAHRSSPIA